MVPPRGVERGAELGRLLSEHARAFSGRFGGGAGRSVRLFFAPGRVNLMGAHLDYNGGPVMPAAVDRGTFVAARYREDGLVRLASTLEPGIVEVESVTLEGLAPRGQWADYPLGVLVALARRGLIRGRRTPGIELLFGGNLPIGAGLSSSASICVGTALALDRVWEIGASEMDLVHIALEAERRFVGVQCGIMDPYAVGLARPGHLLWLDCKDASTSHIPLDTERLVIGVADSRVRRELARGEFNQRVAECERAAEVLVPSTAGATCLRDVPLESISGHGHALSDVERRRAEHVIREVARTFTARAALEAGDAAGLGREMTRAHESLRDLYDVSCPELDRLVESAVATEGVLGARLTGAGFGGCIVALLERGAERALEARLVADFEREFGVRPTVDFYTGGGGPMEV